MLAHGPADPGCDVDNGVLAKGRAVVIDFDSRPPRDVDDDLFCTKEPELLETAGLSFISDPDPSPETNFFFSFFVGCLTN